MFKDTATARVAPDRPARRLGWGAPITVTGVFILGEVFNVSPSYVLNLTDPDATLEDVLTLMFERHPNVSVDQAHDLVTLLGVDWDCVWNVYEATKPKAPAVTL